MATLKVFATDYNNIRDKVEALLGTTGIASRGYGQELVSTPVFQGGTINKSDWDNLAYDIINLKTHQDGVPPPIILLTPGEPIQDGLAFPSDNYDLLAEQADTVRFNLGAGRSILSERDVETRVGSWNKQATAQLVVTFGSANEARYFFNSGGQLRLVMEMMGGSTAGYYNWSDVINEIVVLSFTWNNLIQSNSYLDSILTDNFNANVLNYTSEVNYVNSYFSKNLIDIATKPNGITIEGSNYLLQEDGSYLLQENGFKIIL